MLLSVLRKVEAQISAASVSGTCKYQNEHGNTAEVESILTFAPLPVALTRHNA